MNRIGTIGMSLCIAWIAQARTIALWPLNWDAANGRLDGRCAINAANNLSDDASLVYDWGSVAGLAWTQPGGLVPSPDYLFDPTVTNATYSTGTAAAKNFAYSTTVGRYVTGTNDFTVEGWFRFTELPDSGKLYFIADSDGLNGAAGNQRWFLTFRNYNTFNGVTWQICPLAHGGRDTLLYTLSSDETTAILKGWHHFALSLQQGETNAVWRFYQDGTLLGSNVVAKITGAVNPSGYFGLGCRNNAGNVFKGSLACCRLSDQALDPADFLIPATTKRTLGHWKLNRNADGSVDGAPLVGNAHISGGMLSWSPNKTYSDAMTYPDSDCAFAGNPQNPTVVLPNGNTGSLLTLNLSQKTTMRVNDLGYQLTLTNDFTCEGWIKPWQRDTSTPYRRHLVGTRLGVTSTAGWCFQLQGTPKDLQLEIYCEDHSGRIAHNLPLGSIRNRENEWMHLALTYDHSAGSAAQGVWSCYVDGVFSGSATNSITPRDAGIDNGNFKFIQVRGEDLPFLGNFDCWRVCKSVLRPTQLMCATENAEAADNVLALWPMNAVNGLYVDGTDIMGNYTFESAWDAQYCASGCDTAPEIPGFSRAGDGSVGFRVNETAKKAFLILNNSPAVTDLFKPEGSTFEVFLRREEDVSTAEAIFFATTSPGEFPSLGTQYANMTYKKDLGFNLYCSIQNGDRTFRDPNGNPILLEPGVWTHLALTYERTSAGHVFTLFINGIPRGSTTYASGTPSAPSVLWLGGRPTSENGFRGEFSNLRITRGVLDPSEFLCAATNAVSSTFAYWPLDYADNTLDLTGRVRNSDGLHPFTASSGISGSATCARSPVPRPDSSASFQGTPSANTGSIVLSTNGYVQATGFLGATLDVNAAFTVEGWVKWARSAGAAAEVVAGTYTAFNDSGWKLVLDSTGATPSLRLFAKIPDPGSTLADGVLLDDASILQNSWHHLALRYDSGKGKGTWSLLLDGQLTGSVENRFICPTSLNRNPFRLGAFSGNVSFGGGYDLWRISKGVLEKDDLLYKPKGGTIITICSLNRNSSGAQTVSLANAALVPIEIQMPPPAYYLDPANIHYQTGPSITVAPNGRIWVAIMTGGTGEENRNYVDLLTSGDGGDTWSEPKMALDIDGPMRTFDPAMWTDPEGRVWLFWCQVYEFWDGRGGLWATVCDNPGEENAAWSAPRRLCDGVMKN
ncbi:MAG: hypothetical protein IJR99_02330, partial [Kiritimatiellae bacterium]|nr:hypothetical protein [Kiritimatiellia bacterium]